MNHFSNVQSNILSHEDAFMFFNFAQDIQNKSVPNQKHHRYMAEVLPILRTIISNQLITQSTKQKQS